MEPAPKPASHPVLTFLQMGGLLVVLAGVILNLLGLISLITAGHGSTPPRLLILSIIGLPMLVLGFVMMAICFTVAAKRCRRRAAERG